MTDSPNLTLPYIADSQASKHLTHNLALKILDTIVQAAVINLTTTAPPGSPTEGDRYFVAATASGAWTGHENEIAAYIDGAWAFYAPKTGWLIYDEDTDAYLYWDGSALSAFPSGGGGGGTFTMERVAFTSSGTWTKDAGLYAIRVRCVGGGGGGGSSSAAGAGASSAGGGGASGSYSEKFILAASLGATETVTIGAAGTGGTGGGDGGTGGTTSFGSHISCLGGLGGAAGGTAGSNFSARLGGVGQAATGGDVNVNGNPGSLGFRNAQVAMGGFGASSPFGAGGAPIVTASTPGAYDGTGKGAGGGGSGTGQSSSANNGGVGTAGYCEVFEYYFA